MKKPQAKHEVILSEISNLLERNDCYKQAIYDYKASKIKPMEHFQEIYKRNVARLKELEAIEDKTEENNKTIEQIKEINSGIFGIANFSGDYEDWKRSQCFATKEDKQLFFQLTKFNQENFDKEYLKAIEWLSPMYNIRDKVNSYFVNISAKLITQYYNNTTFIITEQILADKQYYVGDYSIYAFIKGSLSYKELNDKFFDFMALEKKLIKYQKEAEQIVEKLQFFI